MVSGPYTLGLLGLSGELVMIILMHRSDVNVSGLLEVTRVTLIKFSLG